MDNEKLANPLFTLTIGEYIELEKALVQEVLDQSLSNLNINLAKEILSIDEAAELLSLSKSHIYKLTYTRRIPHFKKHKRILFKREDLINYISEGRIKTNSEIEGDALQYVVLGRRNKK